MKEIIDRRKLKNRAVRFLVQKAQKLCLEHFKYDYEYSPAEAIEELGVDETEHIQRIIDALKSIAGELGLDGSLAEI